MKKIENHLKKVLKDLKKINPKIDQINLEVLDTHTKGIIFFGFCQTRTGCGGFDSIEELEKVAKTIE